VKHTKSIEAIFEGMLWSLPSNFIFIRELLCK